jgi:hypothetical protein
MTSAIANGHPGEVTVDPLARDGVRMQVAHKDGLIRLVLSASDALELAERIRLVAVKVAAAKTGGAR